MGIKTKIPYCDSTWNIVTGCLHGCDFCYARRIAERFGIKPFGYVEPTVLEEPIILQGKKEPYPLGFAPTFHRYRLDEPRRWKKPRTIFVCSMADLFGEWVPDTWIQEVFDACRKAPQHRYLFLTKNGDRYKWLYDSGMMPIGVDAFGMWFGCTITKPTDSFFYNDLYANGIDHNGFLSIEPIHDDFAPTEFDPLDYGIKWIIVGAETGNRKGKVLPKREWIEHLAQTCDASGIPIFMKESLRELMGADFRQEYPWSGMPAPADAR